MASDPGNVFESDEERRVLGHLPAWRNEEDQREANRLQAESMTTVTKDGQRVEREVEPITSHDVASLTRRMTTDPHTDLDESGIQEILEDLESRGYAKHKGGQWSQTKQGFESLNS